LLNKKLKTYNASTVIHNEYDSNYPILTGESKSRIQNKNNNKIILWMGHLDVQPPGDSNNWNKIDDPFKPIKIENKIYGRGSLDTKSQVAAQLCSLDIINELNLEHNNLKFIYTTDEEIGSYNSTIKFFSNSLKHDIRSENFYGAINGENTNERIILGCKGIIKFKIKALDPIGRAHSGKSMFHIFHPVVNLSHFISKIRKKSNLLIDELNALTPKFEIIDEDEKIFDRLDSPSKINQDIIILPLKGLKIAIGKELWDNLTDSGWSIEDIGKKYISISFNPGNFLSGSEEAQTIVPYEASSEIDMRIPPKVELDLVFKIIENLRNQFEHIQTEILIPKDPKEYKFFRGCYSPPSNPFIKESYEIIKSIEGEYPHIMPFSSGTSDDRFLDVIDIPHIKFGSKGANAHGFDEYVEAASFFKIIKIYTSLMVNL
jgi:acetylornithine deacetylase/succinyl-diaminopimelate desuccinylase-like protein